MSNFDKGYLGNSHLKKIGEQIEFTPELVEIYRQQGYPITDRLIESASKYSLPKIDNINFTKTYSTLKTFGGFQLQQYTL